jgi:hypothetical protein
MFGQISPAGVATCAPMGNNYLAVRVIPDDAPSLTQRASSRGIARKAGRGMRVAAARRSLRGSSDDVGRTGERLPADAAAEVEIRVSRKEVRR